jgi:hypothetical protein
MNKSAKVVLVSITKCGTRPQVADVAIVYRKERGCTGQIIFVAIADILPSPWDRCPAAHNYFSQQT